MATDLAAQSSSVLELTTGVRILSIDGGGIRGIIPIKLLQALKAKTGKEPYQLFDIICGTSTGGILAILLGVLKIKVDKVLTFYETLGTEIFPKETLFERVKNLIVHREAYSSEHLEKLIKNVIKEAGFNEEELLSSPSVQPGVEGRPYVFAVSTQSGDPFLFRNYAGTTDNGAAGTNHVKIWEAARATSAATTYFLPMQINGKQYVDGGVGNNNPAALALQELSRIPALSQLFPVTLVSLGTGLCTSTGPAQQGFIAELSDVVDSSTDTEKMHYVLTNMATSDDYLLYWRLNPPTGSTPIGLDDASAEGELERLSDAYISLDSTQQILEDINKATAEKPLPPGNDIGVALRLKFHGIAKQFQLKYEEHLVANNQLFLSLSSQTKCEVQAVIILNAPGGQTIEQKVAKISECLQ